MKIVVILSCAALVILIVLLALYLLFIRSRVPKPKSDVEIVYKIGWNGYADTVRVNSLEAEVLYDGLNLFNAKALVQYTLQGSIKYKPGWRPYIKAVHLSERWANSVDPAVPKTGDILVMPIPAVKKDIDYQGETLDFTVKVQDYLSAGGWGENVYNVSSYDLETRIVLMQRK